jgi:hypothetical protein
MANPTPPSITPTAPTAFQQPPALSQIETKVRRLTRSPSTSQLSQSDLDNYINTFVVYDFPEHLRTFNLRKPFTFYTNPGQDVYNTDIASFAGATNNILYNFQNLIISINQPVYIAGYQSLFTQSRNQFFGIYPLVNSIASIGVTGNGTPGPFSGVINSQQSIVPTGTTQYISLLQSNVLFSAFGTVGTSEEIGMALVDVPVVDPVSGFKLNMGNLYDPNSAEYQAALLNPPTAILSDNFVNYLTGQFTISFTLNTISGTPINSQTVPQNLSLPQAMLYYNNQFTLRPVPDQAYAVNFEVYQRPTALLAENQVPELEEYWQYIAYGAAKKIFEDRMDLDSVQMILPEYKKQEALCLRRTIVQNTNERVATIYTENTSTGYGWGWNNGGGSF